MPQSRVAIPTCSASRYPLPATGFIHHLQTGWPSSVSIWVPFLPRLSYQGLKFYFFFICFLYSVFISFFNCLIFFPHSYSMSVFFPVCLIKASSSIFFIYVLRCVYHFLTNVFFFSSFSIWCLFFSVCLIKNSSSIFFMYFFYSVFTFLFIFIFFLFPIYVSFLPRLSNQGLKFHVSSFSSILFLLYLRNCFFFLLISSILLSLFF